MSGPQFYYNIGLDRLKLDAFVVRKFGNTDRVSKLHQIIFLFIMGRKFGPWCKYFIFMRWVQGSNGARISTGNPIELYKNSQ